MPRGGFVAPTTAGGQYENEIETDRQLLLDALGGVQGILRGYTVTRDPAALALRYAPGAAVFAGDDAPDQGSYYIWDAVETVVAFDVPSVQARIDAVVVGCRDPQYGALPAGKAAGPFREVVKGTPATSPVAPTDAAIDAIVGTGVWRRERNVRINPGDTVIAAANITVLELRATRTEVQSGTVQININNSTNGEGQINFPKPFASVPNPPALTVSHQEVSASYLTTDLTTTSCRVRVWDTKGATRTNLITVGWIAAGPVFV